MLGVSFLEQFLHLTSIFTMTWDHPPGSHSVGGGSKYLLRMCLDGYVFTWRIVQFSKYLITMVMSKSPISGVVGPLQRVVSWLINGGYYLLTKLG